MSKFIPPASVQHERDRQRLRREFMEGANEAAIAEAKDLMRNGERVGSFLRERGFSPKHSIALIYKIASEIVKERDK